ncbi:SanA/YdcF family protein [Sansalvadorimonas verongulae]|uniref:SanA/YdcF family protein n=1 Tax=Sansalvadorimonas verongulae TaxID=2172824 RepID=UPI0012BBAF1B|nr:ElyC/SanA/YdcF family protein [Sansalvadorimonas verongulae]MTI13167.1 SanA protein [Sansalvadorimonas verongulae]
MPGWLNRNKLLTLTGGLLAAVCLGLALCYLSVAYLSSPYLYDKPAQLPQNEVGVVLGTSRYTSKGKPNGHYHRRMEAVAQLVKAKRIRYVVVSGDNGTRWYDEPTQMRRDLIRLGVPADIIYRDYAGFRTLDSIIRARDVFGQTSFTIISQKFQNERAVYIAHQNGIDAVAFNASGELLLTDHSNQLREILARVLAIIETQFLNTGPKVLGPPVIIGETPPT